MEAVADMDQVLQKDYKNLQGRSAILDCVVRDADGRQFDVEIDELPETHIILITRDDVLGYDLPIYHIGRRIQEVNESFKDESYIIYVNSSKQDDSELGRLMHDFHCKSAADIHSEVLAKRVYELKETQEGVDSMCREMDQIYSEGAKRGRTEGIAEGIEVGEMKKGRSTPWRWCFSEVYTAFADFRL